MALPDDDDEPLPRRRPALDEVHAAHAAAGEYLPPLGPPLTPASVGTGLPASPMSSGMPPASGMTMPQTMGSMPQPMSQPMGSMPQPMSQPVSQPMTQMPQPMAQPMGQPMGAVPGMPPPYPQPMNSTTVIDNGGGGMGAAMMNQQTMQMTGMAATAQAQASVGLAQTGLDKELLDDQLKKEDEHWVKSYWRPAMGWLYMLICFMDFVGFPSLSMFLPVIMRGFGITMQYVAWQSLTLSNGGLIHLAFGAILGVAAFSRGQEKLASMK